ncbi:MAG: DUF2339 domain-containing protein [Phycisphaeraceae bacterium]|nr:DUF2339 domain-containing protein [Phycisphaeraceae bacterium]
MPQPILRHRYAVPQIPAASPPRAAAPPPAQGPAWSGVLMEQFVGTRLLVWIAALAMAFAGIFLAKYSYERGLLSPSIRLALAALFGLALLGAAEFLRKHAAQIAQALAAASVAVLFACILVGVYQDHLLPSSVAAVLMVMVTVLAVGFSLRHGPLVAVLGLVGGFFTPVLIGPEARNPALEILYLILLQVGLLLVARRQQWWPLSLLTMLGTVIWALVWLISPQYALESIFLGSFMLASLVGVVAASWGVGGGGQAFSRVVDGLRWLSVIASMGILAAMLPLREFTWLEWFFYWLLAAGCLVGGRVNHRYHPLAWLSATLALILVWFWSQDLFTPLAAQDYRAVGLVLSAFGALFAVGGCLCIWGAKTPEGPALWAGLSAVSAVAYLLTAYRLLAPPWLYFYGELCVALAVLYLPAAILLYRRRAVEPGANNALGSLSLGIFALVALAVPLELEPTWLAVAWAIQLGAVAWMHRLWRIAMLRVAIGVLLVVVVRQLLLNAQVFTYPIGARPLFNWLLYGYGLPALALAFASFQLRRSDGPADWLAGAVEVGAIALTFALISLQVHHYFHGQEWEKLRFDLCEAATYSWLWLGFGGALLVAGNLRHRALLRVAGCVLVFVGLSQAILGQGLWFNPLWIYADLGPHRFSPLLFYSYGLPAVMGLGVSWLLRRGSHPTVAAWVESLSLMLLFLLVSLFTFQGFHRDILIRDYTFDLKHSSTFAWVWQVFGIVLLGLTRWWPRATLRWTGTLLVCLALATVILLPLTLRNPLWHPYPVGERIVWNWLLYFFGLPAVLLVVTSREYARPSLAKWKDKEKGITTLLHVVSLLLVFTLVTLEVRQAFHGSMLCTTQISPARPSQAELYSYSAAWIVFGAMLLLAGIALKSALLRWASLLVLLLAVGKVFLYDTRQLGSLYRVFSLFGLGLSLLVLAYLYQKLVFREELANRQKTSDPTAGTAT